MFLNSIFHSRIFFLFFISLYSLNTLFTETNSSWLICEFIKDTEIRTSIVFNLSFSNNTFLFCFFFFFFIIDLYFLITAMIAQMFIPTTELVKPIGAQTYEANADIERNQ